MTLAELAPSPNEALVLDVLQAIVSRGVTEFCVCPGGRCAPLVAALKREPALKKHYWFEERSAGFFALGRARATGRPVAVVTTSGTAAGELLPAVMEAHYTGTPLLVVTADRPRRFRQSGAPQTAEQVGLYGVYAQQEWDLAAGESISLMSWKGTGPAHVNVCFEEPLQIHYEGKLKPVEAVKFEEPLPDKTSLDQFFENVKNPLAIVSTLKPQDRQAVVDFLVKLKIPVYLEGPSGIRENTALQQQRVTSVDSSYDGILRIGGVPTLRFWRDLEEMEGKIAVCSISDVPFSGLSWASVICGPVGPFFSAYQTDRTFIYPQQASRDKLEALFASEPDAEPSVVNAISKTIPHDAHVYLGNSLPIREWDLAATWEDRGFQITASRGLNGIDGQISTFLGMCDPERDNWAILGDLTTLYDMAGPWILQQMPDLNVTIVIINNSGGKIFSRLFPDEEFQNPHGLTFEPLAKMWGLHYSRNAHNASGKQRLLEMIPDNAATDRFWERYKQECQ